MEPYRTQSALTDTIPAYVHRVLEDATRISGAPLLVTAERLCPEFDADLALAAEHERVHILRYSHKLEPFRTHFLVSAATKVQRVFSLPPEERLVPAVPVAALLPLFYHAQLKQKFPPHLPSATVLQHSRVLRTGLTRQLTSFPLDCCR